MVLGQNSDDSPKVEMTVELVNFRRKSERKRAVNSGEEAAAGLFPSPGSPAKKQSGDANAGETGKFPLESLPPDVLIQVVCGVDHDDLKSLIPVSKSVNEAALIAKQSHFAYSTPKKFRAFRTEIDFEDSNEEFEAPAAPRRKLKPRSIRKEVSSIYINLFPSPGEEWWGRKPLMTEEKVGSTFSAL